MTTIADTQSNGVHPAASPTKVLLTPSTAGIFHFPTITQDSAKSASDLLQENHIKNHIFFNQSGFHNHIAHHLLTIYALGATPGQLSHGFAQNSSYQRPQHAIATDVVKQMFSSRDKFASFYGKARHFRDYEEFFEREIEKKGIKETLKEWLFKGDEVAEGLLTRLFAGFLHPVIHFGFALEFHQPVILNESLAQAAIHDNWIAPYLLGCEKAATTSVSSPTTSASPSLISLLHTARSNSTIRSSPHRSDSNLVRDGVLARAGPEMIKLASQWTVQPTAADLRFKTAEMIQHAIYFTAAAQNPRKIPKFDFFYMHSANASIFFSSFVEDPENRAIFGLDNNDNDGNAAGDDAPVMRKNLARLLEMKARTDLAIYVSRGSPALDSQRIRDYQPKRPEQGWREIFERACAYDDDGHASKLVRTVANGERACREFEEKEEQWPIRGADMWLKIGHMVIDSVEADGPRWVRNTGWEESWSEVPDRTEGKL